MLWYSRTMCSVQVNSNVCLRCVVQFFSAYNEVHYTVGRNYTSHFRPYPMATCSSPSLLDITVTYDYSTEVDARDSSAPAPTMQQLAQLFTVKVRTQRENGASKDER